MQNDYESRRRGESDVSTRLAYLLIGGGIGAILALLFAPKSGHELRGDIAEATRKGIDRTRETGRQIGSRAGEYYEVTRDRASELYSTATDKAGEIAARKAGTVSAAIEAGRRAYAEEKRRTASAGELEAGSPYQAGEGQS
ncbi:MAG TPA: YtxH domain-containing protein [Pyrinomonadaceae bacterium]|nr:YtxH domain-containing protein [Pyrinomonadaceae bacterium]